MNFIRKVLERSQRESIFAVNEITAGKKVFKQEAVSKGR
jgi:hypothetical protein